MSQPDINLDDEPDEPERNYYPFMRLTAGPNGVRSRAGWMDEDGELDSLLVDSQVGVQQAQDAFALAFGWYVQQLNLIEQQAAAAAEDDGQDGEERR